MLRNLMMSGSMGDVPVITPSVLEAFKKRISFGSDGLISAYGDSPSVISAKSGIFSHDYIITSDNYGRIVGIVFAKKIIQYKELFANNANGDISTPTSTTRSSAALLADSNLNGGCAGVKVTLTTGSGNRTVQLLRSAEILYLRSNRIISYVMYIRTPDDFASVPWFFYMTIGTLGGSSDTAIYFEWDGTTSTKIKTSVDLGATTYKETSSVDKASAVFRRFEIRIVGDNTIIWLVDNQVIRTANITVSVAMRPYFSFFKPSTPTGSRYIEIGLWSLTVADL